MHAAVRIMLVSVALATSVAAHDGRIVVVSDEYPLSNGRAFNAPNDAATFAVNIVSWFSEGAPGRFLVYSTNFGLTGTQLRAAVEGAGHTWVVSTTADTSLANLLTYDGVFLAGAATINAATLTEYVQAGGSVFIAAGTGNLGSAAAEAALHNPFLESFGLRLDGPFVTTSLDVPISGSAPVLAGVDHLYAWGANLLSDLTPDESSSSIVFTHSLLKIGTYEGEGSCPLAGDLNCDCIVDLIDLAGLLSSYGMASGATRADGDLDQDGDVDLGDLAAVLSAYGSSCP